MKPIESIVIPEYEIERRLNELEEKYDIISICVESLVRRDSWGQSKVWMPDSYRVFHRARD